MSIKQPRNVLNGYRNKYNGKYFEDIITKACYHYLSQGVALILKTPEPMKPIKDLGQGKFVAHYEQHAQPDYKGIYMGGRTVIFEAKHTESDRLLQTAVTEAQTASFNWHEKFGADCFVLVSFGFREFFKVPWATFKAMKEIYGRKYIKPEDIQEYKISYTGGILKFLG